MGVLRKALDEFSQVQEIIDARGADPNIDTRLDGIDTTVATFKIIQARHVQTGNNLTSGTNIPLDNTVPQITEGSQAFSIGITPISTSNKIVIIGGCWVTANGIAAVVSLFRDSGANALFASASLNSGLHSTPIPIFFSEPVPSTNPITYKVRFSSELNGRGGANLGVTPIASGIVVMEVKP